MGRRFERAVLKEQIRDYRDDDGTGYVIMLENGLYFWDWYEPPFTDEFGPESTHVSSHSLAEALRDAADDYESNGEGVGRRTAVLRAAASREDKRIVKECGVS